MKFIIEESKVQPGWWSVAVIFRHQVYFVTRVQYFSEATEVLDKARQELTAKLTETK